MNRLEVREAVWEAPLWYWQKYIPNSAEAKILIDDPYFYIKTFGNFLFIENKSLRWRVLLWDPADDVEDDIAKWSSSNIVPAYDKRDGPNTYAFLTTILYAGKELLHPHAPILYFRSDDSWGWSLSAELETLLLRSFEHLIISRVREAGFIPIPFQTGISIQLLSEYENVNHQLLNSLSKAISSLKFKFKVYNEEITLSFNNEKSNFYDYLHALFFSDGVASSPPLKVILIKSNGPSHIDIQVDVANDSLRRRLEKVVNRALEERRGLESREFNIKLSSLFDTSIRGILDTGLTLPVSYWGPDGFRHEDVWLHYITLRDVELRFEEQSLYVGDINNFAFSRREVDMMGLRIALKESFYDIREGALNITAINAYLREVGSA